MSASPNQIKVLTHTLRGTWGRLLFVNHHLIVLAHRVKHHFGGTKQGLQIK